MEILVQTGTPLKQLDLDVNAQLDYDFRCFFLNRPRVQLFRRIDQRCCDMLAGGLLQVGCADPQAVKAHLCIYDAIGSMTLPCALHGLSK